MMFRKHILFALLAIALLFPQLGALAGQASSDSASTVATPENAAAFIGDWTLVASEATFALSIKTDSGKVVADISSDIQSSPEHITDISKSATNLALKYNFNYNGSPVPVVVTLKPNGDKVDMTVDFAGGSYVMSGKATKKS